MHDAKFKRAKNNIERRIGAKGYRVGVLNTVMSGSVGGLKGRFVPPSKPTNEKVRFGEGVKVEGVVRVNISL